MVQEKEEADFPTKFKQFKNKFNACSDVKCRSDLAKAINKDHLSHIAMTGDAYYESMGMVPDIIDIMWDVIIKKNLTIYCNVLNNNKYIYSSINIDKIITSYKGFGFHTINTALRDGLTEDNKDDYVKGLVIHFLILHKHTSQES